jgi:hypothetical protein
MRSFSVGMWARAASSSSRRCRLPMRHPPVRSYIHIIEPSARATWRGMMPPGPEKIGIRNGSTLTRWGALRSRRWRSWSASYTSRTSPFCRYRSPPWTSFDDLDDVPDAKSSRSTRAVRRPREAASSATPAPVIPPPTTSTS